VGITLALEAQSHGYASEALACLSEHAFNDVGVERLHAGVDPANAAVIRLLTRAGWRHEGTTVQSYWHRDHWADDATYGLARTSW
jgi:aminoglycoside 6'-N-acetyltransferase